MTTATLLRAEAVSDTTTGSRRPGHMVWSETGRCVRDHDITDPANVFVYTRSDGRRQKACRLCRRFRDTGRQPNYPDTYPVLTCQQCQQDFTKPDALTITLRGWMRRVYCSPECSRAASTARKLAGGLDAADMQWSLAACEGLVQSAEDDVFFEPDQAPHGRPAGARAAIAKLYCAVCPIRSGCLRYALDRNIDCGVWGGLDAAERRNLSKTARAKLVVAS